MSFMPIKLPSGKRINLANVVTIRESTLSCKGTIDEGVLILVCLGGSSEGAHIVTLHNEEDIDMLLHFWDASSEQAIQLATSDPFALMHSTHGSLKYAIEDKLE